MTLKTLLYKKDLPYDGQPLRSHWAYQRFGLLGDSLVAFEGPCDVAIDALADLEDAKAGAFIYSPRMLHFILELFGPSLAEAVQRQWLLVSTLQAELNLRLKAGKQALRMGNDLYVGNRKLSVSIAAPTPVSVKVHLGVNILSKGAPVAAIGLKELGVPAASLARAVLAASAHDHVAMQRARAKVRLYP